MRDNDLNKRLGAYQAPEPSDLLKARILKRATAQPAKRPSWTRRLMPIAACLMAVFAIGFAGLQLSQPDTTEDIWLEAANDLGVSEIYAWVEGEDGT